MGFQDYNGSHIYLKHVPKAKSTLGFIQNIAIPLLSKQHTFHCVVWNPYLSKAACFVKCDYNRHSNVTSMMKELNWNSL